MDKLKVNIKIDKGIDKFDEEVKEYERRFTPSWLRELSEQYGSLGKIPEDCIPAEHREAFKFFTQEMKKVREKCAR